MIRSPASTVRRGCHHNLSLSLSLLSSHSQFTSDSPHPLLHPRPFTFAPSPLSNTSAPLLPFDQCQFAFLPLHLPSLLFLNTIRFACQRLVLFGGHSDLLRRLRSWPLWLWRMRSTISCSSVPSLFGRSSFLSQTPQNDLYSPSKSVRFFIQRSMSKHRKDLGVRLPSARPLPSLSTCTPANTQPHANSLPTFLPLPPSWLFTDHRTLSTGSHWQTYHNHSFHSNPDTFKQLVRSIAAFIHSISFDLTTHRVQLEFC
jgi:hypothetical protein